MPNFNDCEDEYYILAHGEWAPCVICNQLLKSLASFQEFIAMILKLVFHLMVKSQSSKQYSTVTLHNVKKATIRCHLLLYYLRFVSDAYISKYVIYYF